MCRPKNYKNFQKSSKTVKKLNEICKNDRELYSGYSKCKRKQILIDFIISKSNPVSEQYEESKIQEARDTPTVQILDHAVLPKLKYKPVRSRVFLIGFVLSTVFSMYYVYFRRRWQIANSAGRIS